MTFEELLNEAIALLRRQGRLSYGALKRQFDVDDQCIQDLKVEIVDVLELAVDQDGKILVWTGPRPEASAAESAPPPPPAVEPARVEAERRQLTVMFCDLVDSTSLAVQLDPEDLREVLRAYQETASTVVQRFGGHIAQYLGDGILVYFGYPAAHDDDAMRAIRTGLETVEAMEALNTRLATRERVPLAIRVGIHTGPVVVGEVGTDTRYEHLAMGETPNVAARVQGLAPPNGVVVTAATWRLAQGFFVGENLGAQSLKGVVQPIGLYRVLGESGARSRLEAAAPGGFTPLVGRDSETRLLIERWSQSKERIGQAVLFSGEAGVGKSRLVDVLGDHVLGEGGAVISFRCSPYRTNSALYPIIDHLQRLVDFRRTETAETKVAKLEAALAGYRSVGDRAVPLLAALLSVPLPEDRRAPPLSPQQVKEQTMETLTAWLIEQSERQPVLTAFEDLHWADPSTLEMLGLLIDELPTARMLMMLTFRPDFRPPWTSRSYFTHLTLNRFTRAQTEAMIAAVTRGTALPAEVVQQVVAKTDGVPLFIEELLKMIIESGLLREEEGRYELRGPLPRLAIPTTLQDSLMARLDRIATAREIAQIGATVGREFSYEMVSAVSTMTSDVLDRGLAQLAEAELVYARGRPPQATYLFKHALIRDAAYESLLKSRRRMYHERIARALEEKFPESRETQPEVVAHHCTEAGLHESAIRYWQRAGQRAIERSANLEAIAYLTKGLELVELLPEGVARTQAELGLRVALGVPLIATKGYAAVEVERTYARARELSQQVGESPQLAHIVWGLWVYYLTGGPISTALAMAEQYCSLAERLQQPDLLLETCQVVGIALFYMGEFARARPQLERGGALYDPAQHHALIFAHGGADTGVALQTHEALTLWALGYPDRARDRMATALRTAHSLSHPFSLAFAHYFSAWLHKLCREEPLVHEAASAAIGICDQNGFPFWGMSSAALRGSTRVEQGAYDEGIMAITQSLESYQATGAALYRPELLGLLATALAKTDRVEEARQVLLDAFAAMERSHERWWHAELHRLHGELYSALPGDHAAEAEASFRRALDVARSQEAKSWELRAAMSLARLLQRRGDAREAHAVLGDVYHWFIEGFDTADLREAGALLADLQPHSA